MRFRSCGARIVYTVEPWVDHHSLLLFAVTTKVLVIMLKMMIFAAMGKRGRTGMTAKDTAFKTKLDALKEQARMNCMKEIREAEVAKTAYIRGIDDVMRAYIDVERDRDA